MTATALIIAAFVITASALTAAVIAIDEHLTCRRLRRDYRHGLHWLEHRDNNGRYTP